LEPEKALFLDALHGTRSSRAREKKMFFFPKIYTFALLAFLCFQPEASKPRKTNKIILVSATSWKQAFKIVPVA
jgi:hypothetical protein